MGKENLLEAAVHGVSQLLFGKKVLLQLVSLDIDPATPGEGKRTPKSELQLNPSDLKDAVEGEDSCLPIKFSVPADFGTPAAVLIESHHPTEFFLKSITLELPDATEMHFSCNSWIHEASIYPGPRIFFPNQVYLPKDTPAAMVKLRQEELTYLRGDGTGERKTGERIYDYDFYNNLGNPDKDKSEARPVLGGSKELPYPRRCRTGGKRTKFDPASEDPSSSTYVPRDDHFSATKTRQLAAAYIRAYGHEAIPALQDLIHKGRQFIRFNEIYNLYDEEAQKIPADDPPKDGTITKYPIPAIIKVSKEAWMSDQEFARERLAGMNPLVIERLKVFPPESKLDPQIYGLMKSCITAEHIEGKLEGLTVEQAMHEKRLFIMDYHDFMMPYLDKINALDGKAYASRTLFFLTKPGVLLPVAIELTLPPNKESGKECESRVFTPPDSASIDWIWQLAKTHVAINDTAYQHLCSHWLRTHASMEPFIIATHRQLSVLHPLYVLLFPHFKDTMSANSAARESFLNSNGPIEKGFTTGKYSNEVSSLEYKRWQFDEQALPKDLIKRGMAEKHEQGKHGLKLAIEDYPYAVDGLELWEAIEKWVVEYVSIYYKEDKEVREDEELQAWWREVKEVGHGDHKDAPWWVKMETVGELMEVAATLIWVATGLHAVVNFGQYAHTGFMPNSPAKGRRLIPPEGSSELAAARAAGEAFLLGSVASVAEAATIMTTFERTSQHTAEEQYVGDANPDPYWTADPHVLEAFERFRVSMAAAEEHILARNHLATINPSALPHRAGPALFPFSLLVPSSEPGLTQRGVPNSISA